MKHKIGDDIYVPSAWYMSRGSDDVMGGLAKIKCIDISKNLPKGHYNSVIVTTEELPGRSYNYNYLLEIQEDLKKEFGDKRAYPDPDIDTPWIESGDTVNGSAYKGKDIW